MRRDLKNHFLFKYENLRSVLADNFDRLILMINIYNT